MHNWLPRINETWRSLSIWHWHLTYNLSPEYQQGKLFLYSESCILYSLGMDAALCLPFLQPPLPNQEDLLTDIKNNDLLSALPKYNRLCVCSVQRSWQESENSANIQTPKENFSHIELVEATVLHPVTLVYSFSLERNCCLNFPKQLLSHISLISGTEGESKRLEKNVL